MKKEMIDALGLSGFCESMAMMLRAGIQTDEAMQLLVEENTSEGMLTDALRIASAVVDEGKSVSEALEATRVFPEYMVRMISLGERQGQMEDVFFHLSSYYGEQHTISQKLKSLVRYPAVMMLIVLAVLAVMLWKVLPVFTGVYQSMTGSVSASAFSYIDIAYAVCWAVFAVMLIAAALLLLCVAIWPTRWGGAFLQRILEKLPLTAGIMQCLGLYRFFVSLRISLSAGEPQDLAVEEGLKVTHCGPVEKKIKACLERMAGGEGVAQAAYQVGLLEPMYGRMLLAGARSGSLDEVLVRIGELIENTLIERVDRLTGMLDPILSGAMLATVGLSLLSVMLPLIGMMSSIG